MPHKTLGRFFLGHDLRFEFEQGKDLHKPAGTITYGGSILYRNFAQIEYKSDVKEWLSSNVEGSWSNIHWRCNDPAPDRFLIRFSSEDDLLLFKMKWL